MRAVWVWRAVYFGVRGALVNVRIHSAAAKVESPNEQILVLAREVGAHASRGQRAALVLEPLVPTLPERAADCASGGVDDDERCSRLAARTIATRRQQPHPREHWMLVAKARGGLLVEQKAASPGGIWREGLSEERGPCWTPAARWDHPCCGTPTCARRRKLHVRAGAQAGAQAGAPADGACAPERCVASKPLGWVGRGPRTAEALMPLAAPMASASRSTPAPGPRNHGRHGWRPAPAGAAPHGLHRCLQRPWLSRRWQPGLLGVRATGSADGPHPRRWQASRRRAPWALRMALRPATEGANRWEHRRRCGWPHRPGRASSLGQQAIAGANGAESHPEKAPGLLYHPDWKPQRFPPQARMGGAARVNGKTLGGAQQRASAKGQAGRTEAGLDSP